MNTHESLTIGVGKKRRRKARSGEVAAVSVSVRELIDRLFSEPVYDKSGTTTLEMTVLQAIFHQLTLKAASGDKRALKSLLSYRTFMLKRVGPPTTQISFQYEPYPEEVESTEGVAS